MRSLTEELNAKWQPVLEHEDLKPIQDYYRRNSTSVILENTEKEISSGQAYNGTTLLGEAAHTNQTGSEIDNFDPVLISLVRRAMPNLIAYDICGVQPMTGPTGLIFAMRARYSNQVGNETFYNEVNTAFGTVVTGANTLGQKHVGGVPGVSNNAANGSYNFGSTMSTAQAEALGTSGNTAFPEMAFSIEKVSVTAGSRALKAEYTMELAQDLKAIHGLDAETELSNILSTELLAEINREVVRTIVVTAKTGAQEGTTTVGRFDLDTDSNGRWSVEKFKGLLFHIEREANKIAQQTRRGRGNIIVCSSDVASALQFAGILDYAPALNTNNGLLPDDTGNTFIGILNGRYRVYIDPYATGNYMVVGYKGSSPWDAGLFYAPYVPLQMVRAVDQNSFQPKIGFKTRYGMVANPFAEGLTAGLGALNVDSNVYYRRVLIDNIM
jgi:hypothetical protein